MSGRAASRRGASSTSAIGERGRVRLGLRRARGHDRDRERPVGGGLPVRRVDEVVERAAGPEAPRVASRRGDTARLRARAFRQARPARAGLRCRRATARLRAGRPRRRCRRRDRRALRAAGPGGAHRRRARASRRSPCRCRRGRRRRPRSTRALPASGRRRCARRHASRRARRRLALVEELERAVVAGGGERRKDRRVEPSVRSPLRARSAAASASMSRASTIDPCAAGAVEPREVALAGRSARGRARRPRPRAGLRRARARRASASSRPAVDGDGADRAHRAERLALQLRVMPAPRPAVLRGARGVEGRRRWAGGSPRFGARHAGCARRRARATGASTMPAKIRPRVPGEVGADVEGVVEAEREAAEARVVQQAPAALADAAADVEGGREGEHEPAR